MIGITERGDPSICKEWIGRTNDLDGIILITKNPGAFIKGELEKEIEKIKDKLIIHCSITGYGKTIVENNVPPYHTAVICMKGLIDKGYNVVLRIDPIIPTALGFQRAQSVIEYTKQQLGGSLKGLRVRWSLIDNYPHAKNRGLTLPWNSFNVPEEDGDVFMGANTIIRYFKFLEETEDIIVEVCAETYKEIPKIWQVGCISLRDYETINVVPPKYLKTGDQRVECLCLNTKKELLDKKEQCGYGCMYCYWKDPIEQIDDADEIG